MPTESEATEKPIDEEDDKQISSKVEEELQKFMDEDQD